MFNDNGHAHGWGSSKWHCYTGIRLIKLKRIPKIVSEQADLKAFDNLSQNRHTLRPLISTPA